jgi:hypothetical protein
LWTIAEITVSSFCVKNRGVSSRTIISFRLTTEPTCWPKRESAVTARAVARHVVRLSGMSTSTIARPEASVVTIRQIIVSAKFERISVAA